MDSSSSVLRQHSHNKIRSEHMRTKNEHNKMPADPKPPKHTTSVSLRPSGDIENRDPGSSSEAGRPASVRPGISRLPVLAKSLRLQTPSDFPQSLHRWEEKPLTGKAKTKKPCTRPVPFNLSQPKSARTASVNQTGRVRPQPRTHTTAHLERNACSTHPKTKHINAKPSHPPTVFNNNGGATKVHQSEGKAPEHSLHLSGQPVPSRTFTTSALLSNPLPSSFPDPPLRRPSAQPDGAQSCLAHMDLLTLKDTSNKSEAGCSVQTTTQGHSSKGSAGTGELFQPSHAALLSLLRNEGVSESCKPYNYQPQRVSVMKSRHHVGPTAGAPKSAQFSPDAVALQSILQNEGLKPLGATPRASVCPSGRGTSIYTAQRVPVRKNAAETAGGPVAAASKTPLKKWSPQRVPNTRHQPMSSRKWTLSAHRSPFVGTPASRIRNVDLKPHKEEIVQRLFYDQEEEQKTNVPDEDAETRAERRPGPASAIEFQCEEKGGVAHSEEEDEDEDEEREQPFIQASQRESVIFFSTGKKLMRAPRFETQESSAPPEPHTERNQLQEESQINPRIPNLHRDHFVQKSSTLNPAVALLRKRLPQLEELRLDEEVATYISLSVSGAPPPGPRCGNPLASILHFEDSTRFVPIDFDSSPAPSSPCSSPLRER
ncbi:uncharacterized protein troap [Genypterus blacodes]|uniref:uncharacterized protein troap n=1 Tax=Genypterus blacodes TaxID=154954 RepID=UPI003F766096